MDRHIQTSGLLQTQDQIFNAIFKTFSCDKFFVFLRKILLVINPYKRIQSLDSQLILQSVVQDTFKGSLKNTPHIYTVAANAFLTLNDKNPKQSIIIYGDSGAGKTETAKNCLKILMKLGENNSTPNSKIQAYIFLIQTFGSSKTVTNQNSSRFSQLTQIFFDKNRFIKGAKIQTYDLEKSRVSKVQKGERNFHIFYALTASSAFGANYASSYAYLRNQSCFANGINDRHLFARVNQSFDQIGFEKQEKQNIWKLVRVILELGNIQFKQRRDQTIKIIADEQTYKFILSVLRMQKATFQAMILCKKKGQPVKKTSKADCEYIRDQLANNLYGLLFQALQKKIEYKLNRSNQPMSINYQISILQILRFKKPSEFSQNPMLINETEIKNSSKNVSLLKQSNIQENKLLSIHTKFLKEIVSKVICQIDEDGNKTQELMTYLQYQPFESSKHLVFCLKMSKQAKPDKINSVYVKDQIKSSKLLKMIQKSFCSEAIVNFISLYSQFLPQIIGKTAQQAITTIMKKVNALFTQYLLKGDKIYLNQSLQERLNKLYISLLEKRNGDNKNKAVNKIVNLIDKIVTKHNLLILEKIQSNKSKEFQYSFLMINNILAQEQINLQEVLKGQIEQYNNRKKQQQYQVDIQQNQIENDQQKQQASKSLIHQIYKMSQLKSESEYVILKNKEKNQERLLQNMKQNTFYVRISSLQQKLNMALDRIEKLENRVFICYNCEKIKNSRIIQEKLQQNQSLQISKDKDQQLQENRGSVDHKPASTLIMPIVQQNSTNQFLYCIGYQDFCKKYQQLNPLDQQSVRKIFEKMKISQSSYLFDKQQVYMKSQLNEQLECYYKNYLEQKASKARLIQKWYRALIAKKMLRASVAQIIKRNRQVKSNRKKSIEICFNKVQQIWQFRLLGALKKIQELSSSQKERIKTQLCNLIIQEKLQQNQSLQISKDKDQQLQENRGSVYHKPASTLIMPIVQQNSTNQFLYCIGYQDFCKKYQQLNPLDQQSVRKIFEKMKISQSSYLFDKQQVYMKSQLNEQLECYYKNYLEQKASKARLIQKWYRALIAKKMLRASVAQIIKRNRQVKSNRKKSIEICFNKVQQIWQFRLLGALKKIQELSSSQKERIKTQLCNLIIQEKLQQNQSLQISKDKDQQLQENRGSVDHKPASTLIMPIVQQNSTNQFLYCIGYQDFCKKYQQLNPLDQQSVRKIFEKMKISQSSYLFDKQQVYMKSQLNEQLECYYKNYLEQKASKARLIQKWYRALIAKKMLRASVAQIIKRNRQVKSNRKKSIEICFNKVQQIWQFRLLGALKKIQELSSSQKERIKTQLCNLIIQEKLQQNQSLQISKDKDQQLQENRGSVYHKPASTLIMPIVQQNSTNQFLYCIGYQDFCKKYQQLNPLDQQSVRKIFEKMKISQSSYLFDKQQVYMKSQLNEQLECYYKNYLEQKASKARLIQKWYRALIAKKMLRASVAQIIKRNRQVKSNRKKSIEICFNKVQQIWQFRLLGALKKIQELSSSQKERIKTQLCNLIIQEKLQQNQSLQISKDKDQQLQENRGSVDHKPASTLIMPIVQQNSTNQFLYCIGYQDFCKKYQQLNPLDQQSVRKIFEKMKISQSSYLFDKQQVYMKSQLNEQLECYYKNYLEQKASKARLIQKWYRALIAKKMLRASVAQIIKRNRQVKSNRKKSIEICFNKVQQIWQFRLLGALKKIQELSSSQKERIKTQLCNLIIQEKLQQNQSLQISKDKDQQLQENRGSVYHKPASTLIMPIVQQNSTNQFLYCIGYQDFCKKYQQLNPLDQQSVRKIFEKMKISQSSYLFDKQQVYMKSQLNEQLECYYKNYLEQKASKARLIQKWYRALIAKKMLRASVAQIIKRNRQVKSNRKKSIEICFNKVQQIWQFRLLGALKKIQELSSSQKERIKTQLCNLIIQEKLQQNQSLQISKDKDQQLQENRGSVDHKPASTLIMPIVQQNSTNQFLYCIGYQDFCKKYQQLNPLDQQSVRKIFEKMKISQSSYLFDKQQVYMKSQLNEQLECYYKNYLEQKASKARLIQKWYRALIAKKMLRASVAQIIKRNRQVKSNRKKSIEICFNKVQQIWQFRLLGALKKIQELSSSQKERIKTQLCIQINDNDLMLQYCELIPPNKKPEFHQIGCQTDENPIKIIQDSSEYSLTTLSLEQIQQNELKIEVQKRKAQEQPRQQQSPILTNKKQQLSQFIQEQVKLKRYIQQLVQSLKAQQHKNLELKLQLDLKQQSIYDLKYKASQRDKIIEQLQEKNILLTQELALANYEKNIDERREKLYQIIKDNNNYREKMQEYQKYKNSFISISEYGIIGRIKEKCKRLRESSTNKENLNTVKDLKLLINEFQKSLESSQPSENQHFDQINIV